jgi:acetyl esterase/lipase
MLKSVFSGLIAGSLLFVACTKNDISEVQIPITDTVIANLAYGTAANQKMDLYLPAARNQETKLILLIHGGGWNAGDKGELAFLATGFKARGFAVANLNYRLSPQGGDNYAMQLDDVDAALNLLQNKAGAYVYNRNSFYITGHSAGAHLSLSYAYTRNSSGRLKAAGGMASPTDLVAGATANFGIVGTTTISPYLGGPLNSASRATYEKASPVYNVTAGSTPTILFQGTADIIVPAQQSATLRDKLAQNGVPVKLVPYPGAGHDWWGDAARVNNTLDETAAWFRKY